MSYESQSQGGLYSLATIIKRLEAATSRLEDVAMTSASTASLKQNLSQDTSLQTSGAGPVQAAPEEPKSVKAFDDVILQAKLQPYLKLSEELGGAVWEQAQVVSKLYNDLRGLILLASASAKPADADLSTVFKPLSDGITAISKIKDQNRAGPHKGQANHLGTVADGAPAVGWVGAAPKPGPHVSEAKDSAQFFANRVIKEWKDKDTKHIDWAKSYTALLEELRKYVMEYHTTGLVWNPKGGDALKYKPHAKASGTGSAAPPPPPPPPPPPVDLTPAKAVVPAGGAAAVFAELNKGEAVTAGLRKVNKEDMTHKNPSLRASGPVPSATSPGKRPVKPSKPQSLAGKKPSKFEQEGNKWVVEFFEGEKGLVIDKAEQSQSVAIYGCKNSTIQVKGKVNAVTIANCTKTSVLIESVISSVSVANSPSFTIQITGTAPTVTVDATDSGQVYLSKDCLATEIMTAKCSSINISLPVEGEEEGVFVERAIPEMFRTVIKGGKLVTTIVEHSG